MLEHRSRFKAYLINPLELKREAAVMEPYLAELFNLHALQRITDGEYATLFIFLFLNQRSSDWWMKKSQTWPLANGASFLECWLRDHQFKKLPESIARTLYFWMRGDYKIILKFEPVTPEEMLRHQARGERIVTLAHREAVAGQLIEGMRDAFEFLLHDLVHADLFFSDSMAHRKQKDFFSSILKILESGGLNEETRIDPQFQKDFHYLISDMNSHSAHLGAMLKASYIKHLLFLEEKTEKDLLSSESQKKLLFRLEEWRSRGLNLESVDNMVMR